MGREEIKNIYERHFLKKNIFLSDADIPLMYIKEFLAKKKETVILDAGCGNGKYAYSLSDLVYKNIYAIDLFEELKTDKFVYKKGSIDDIPFDNNFFNLIYCNSVIHYLENILTGMMEFNRVLKQGGICIITAHTKYSLFTLWRVIKLALNLKSAQHLIGLKFISAGKYKQYFERCGFEVVLMEGYYMCPIICDFHYKIVRLFSKIFNVNLPFSRKRYICNRLVGRLKSIFAYHSVIIARKL